MSTPISQLNIFDFDQTISNHHTFHGASVKANKDLNVSLDRQEARIKVGAQKAVSNLKQNLPQELFSLEGANLFAIATYHNNPDYIAGYLQHFLGKNIAPTDEVHYSEEPVVAVRIYKIEGSEKPLLISYLPATGQDFNELMGKLDCKNNQINLLQKVALEKQIINGSTHYDFFDDSGANITAARKVFDESNLTAHHIDKNNCSFSLRDNSTDINLAIERSKIAANEFASSPIPTNEHDELYDFDDNTAFMSLALQNPELLSAGVGLLVALTVGVTCLSSFGIVAPISAGIAAGAGLLSGSATFFAVTNSNKGCSELDNNHHEHMKPA